MKTVNIKGETFIVKENGNLRDSCYGCYFHMGTRWNKAGTGNCRGTTRILNVCAENNFGHIFKNVIMLRYENTKK